MDRWAADVEGSSHVDFLFQNDVSTVFGRLIGDKITPTMSISWDFTTKSFMQTCVFTPTDETGILVAHSLPYAGSHDTRLGRESSWSQAPSGTYFFAGR